MNVMLIAAGSLSLAMAVGHTTIGVRWVLPHLRDEALPSSPFGTGAMTANFIVVTWHAVGVMLVSVGVVLSVLATRSLSGDGAIAVRGVGAMFAATTLVVLWLARRRPKGLVRAPMWLLFIAMALLCWLGATT
jgi:hypothetical protein